jgi:hypothetical protein
MLIDIKTIGLSTDCTEEHKHMHIDYYGECQLLPECRKEVLEDFPRRMREWLDHIIRYSSDNKLEIIVHNYVCIICYTYKYNTNTIILIVEKHF